MVREATCNILKNAGFEVLPAEDARTAMKIYEERRPAIDLLMTDLILPGATGQELGHEIQLLSPEVAVLVTSGYPNPESDLEIPESHTYFLAKPYSRRTLIDKIEKILGLMPRVSAAAQAC